MLGADGEVLGEGQQVRGNEIVGILDQLVLGQGIDQALDVVRR